MTTIIYVMLMVCTVYAEYPEPTKCEDYLIKADSYLKKAENDKYYNAKTAYSSLAIMYMKRWEICLRR